MNPHVPESWFASWPAHVVTSAVSGRGLKAARDLCPGDIVLRTTSYACTVADEWRSQVCAYCLDGGEGASCQLSCETCRQVSYCSESCRIADFAQHQIECDGLRSFLGHEAWGDSLVRTEFRLLLRVLSRRTLERCGASVPTSHCYDDFELLIGHRDCVAPDAIANWRKIATHLRTIGKGLDDLETDAIVDAILRARINRFSLLSPDHLSLAEGVFLEAALFNHSCRENIRYERILGGPTIEFRAARKIRAGEDLTVCYIRDSGPEARERLRQDYHFACRCERCSEEFERKSGATIL